MSDDRAMNLSQHAARTGYSREQLARFRPLLIGGKIRPSELDRHIYEYRKAILSGVGGGGTSDQGRAQQYAGTPTPAQWPAVPVTATDPRMQAILDKFHGK